jgi:hypothetical protein
MPGVRAVPPYVDSHPDEKLIFVYHNDRTIFIFEEPNAIVPDFDRTIQLTVGQIFSWLEN